MFSKSIFVLAIAALASSQVASAQPHGRRHLHKRGDVNVVTTTATVATVYVNELGQTVDPNKPQPVVIVTVTAGQQAPAYTAPAAPTTKEEPVKQPETTPKAPASSEEKSEAPAPAPTSEKKTEAPATTQKPITSEKKTEAPATTQKPTTSKKTEAPATTQKPTTTAQSSAAPSPSQSSGNVKKTGLGKGLGITYSPWKKGGSGRICKDEATIAKDLQGIKAFSPIRLYDAGCNVVQAVFKNTDSQVFVGMDLATGDQTSQNAKDTFSSNLKAITSAVGGQWDRVHTIAVGNEHLDFGKITIDAYVTAITEAKSGLKAAGYSGPVVAPDTVNAWKNNMAKLCKVSDYIASNAHPFFTSQDVSTVKDFVAGEQGRLKEARDAAGCSDKPIYFVEAGWPTAGSPSGAAVPSEQNQATAISTLMSSLDKNVILFSAYDEDWKGNTGTTSGTENHWGLKNLNIV